MKTLVRERIGLIESGSSSVVGQARIADCKLIARRSLQNGGRWTYFPRDVSFLQTFKKHGCIGRDLANIGYSQVYAWVLKDVQQNKRPRKYTHLPGAITWINLKRG